MTADLDFRLVMPLHFLAGEVLETHGGLKCVLHSLQVGLQCRRHFDALIEVFEPPPGHASPLSLLRSVIELESLVVHEGLPSKRSSKVGDGTKSRLDGHCIGQVVTFYWIVAPKRELGLIFTRHKSLPSP